MQPYVLYMAAWHLKKIDMVKGIGSIIFKLRNQAGYTQEQLCRGIYSVAELAKIESNQLIPGYFQLDCIFGRLGKSTEKLEYVLPVEIYELYELRYRIQKEILQKRLEGAKALLNEYGQKRQAKKSLHRQFLLKTQAQIAWISGEKTTLVIDLIQQAVEETMPSEGAIEKGMALSAEELKLLLFRWEVCRGTEYERPITEVKNIIDYIEFRHTDADEKGKVYPYAVLLYCTSSREKGEWKEQEELLKKSMELLQETGQLAFFPEILEQTILRMKPEKKNEEQIALLTEQREALLELEKEFQVDFSGYRLFQHINREFELDFEVIQKNRRARGIAQEALCDGICTQETLSRIENGKNSPNNRNFNDLMKRLDSRRQRVNTVISTEEFHIIELKRKFERSIQRLRFDVAEEFLRELEERLDQGDINNLQYLEAEKIKLDILVKRLSKGEGIEKLNSALRKTLGGEAEMIFKHQLTSEEANILNHVGILYYENGEKEKALEIHQRVIRNYESSRIHPVFHIREWGVQMSNMASCLEETGRLAEAVEVSRQRMKTLLTAGKGEELGRSLTTMACALEKMEDGTYKKTFKQALLLLDLMKMDYRYQLVKEYVIQNNILENV